MSCPTDAVYQLQAVGKIYDRRQVLHIEQLGILDGEILGLVGPSGAGKSTLLRLLNFLESPTSGTITYKGIHYDGGAPLAVRRRVTTVFQRPVLLDGTVSYNVSYGLRLRGHRAIADRVEDMLKRVGLSALADAHVATLSGGEAQRVALARALLVEPEVLLLDEPTANLDPYHVTLIEETVCRQNREHGTTTVWVTHNVFQARRVAHRVALLLEGQLVEVADVEGFFNCPQDARTAAFVRGEMVY